ncbi:hypothetical protein RhiirB3_391526 [Rhizophagus irregularis]|nr:hypothetical protein RhiirB3_391526 [Rhizophagus irregularis]
MNDNKFLPKLSQNLLDILNDEEYYDVTIEVVQQGDRSKVKDEEEGWTIYYGKGRARGTYDRGSRVRGGIRGYRGKILDIKPADLPIHPVCVVTVGTATDVPDESLSSKDVNLLDKEIDEESNSEDINKSAEKLSGSTCLIRHDSDQQAAAAIYIKS